MIILWIVLGAVVITIFIAAIFLDDDTDWTREEDVWVKQWRKQFPLHRQDTFVLPVEVEGSNIRVLLPDQTSLTLADFKASYARSRNWPGGGIFYYELEATPMADGKMLFQKRDRDRNASWMDG